MPDAAAGFLDSFAARFQPAGVFGTLQDDRRSAAIVLTFAALAPVLVVAFVVAFAVTNEAPMLVVSLLVLVVDVVALPLLVRTGSLRLYGLLGAWRLVVAGIVGHILLGGFLCPAATSGSAEWPRSLPRWCYRPGTPCSWVLCL